MNEKNKTYLMKDVSVVIATYNRPLDLEITLNSFENKIIKLGELIIVDQSTDDKTKKVLNKFKYKNIKYIHSKKPSLTLARNLGIKKCSNKSKIIIFLDDDVSLSDRYFNEILNVFNEKKFAVGVGGHYFQKNKKINRFANMVRRTFRIEHLENESARVISAYGACYPPKLTKVIKSSWIPGFNMAFKKEILNKDKFDENFFRYALGEDFELTTRLNKKYPKSLFITPFAGIVHRVSEVERLPKPKLTYMNHVNHLYIQKKNFNDFKGIVSTAVALASISVMQILLSILKPNEKNRLKCLLHFKALFYCIKRLNLIRKGNLQIPAHL